MIAKEPILCLKAVLNGIELEIRQGNVLWSNSRCIVNAANENLLNLGGLAGQIALSGGPIVEKECSDYILHNGILTQGKIARTSAGNLPFEYIYHTVGPSNGRAEFSDKEKLIEAVMNTMINSNRDNMTSIGIPAIGFGIFKFPKKEAGMSHIEAYIIFAGQFCVKNDNIQLRKIIFSPFNEDETQHFINAIIEKSKAFDSVTYYGLPREQIGPLKEFCELCFDLIENPNIYFNIIMQSGCCRKICNFCIFQHRLMVCPLHQTPISQDVTNSYDNYILCKICKTYSILNQNYCICRQACTECLQKFNTNRSEKSCLCGNKIYL